MLLMGIIIPHFQAPSAVWPDTRVTLGLFMNSQLHTIRLTPLVRQISSDWKKVPTLVVIKINPGLINPLCCLIGGVAFKYQIMTIGEVPPNE